MDTFWQFCTGVRESLVPKETEIKPRSHSPVPENTDYECANTLCMNTTVRLSTWKIVTMKQHMHCLCSEDCYDEWLSTPFSSRWMSPVYKIRESKSDPPLLDL